MSFVRKILGIKKPSPYKQALETLRAKRTADRWSYEDWMGRNNWYDQWRDYSGDAIRGIGSFNDRFNEAEALNQKYQNDVDLLYSQNVQPLFGDGIGSYASDQQGLFGDRSRAATSASRAFGESNQKLFSDGLAQMAQQFGTSQGGFGSGFASAFGEQSQQASQAAADMFGSTQKDIAADRTNTFDKVFSAQQAAPSKVDQFRKTALDSMIAPTETALAGWDSITSREQQNAPQFA